MRVTPLLERIWYGGHPLKWLLWPFSLLFGLLALTRRSLYRAGLLQQTRLPVPVVVVGNISVGGTGKTPLTLHIIEELRSRGWRPGIVSRGYGGQAMSYPMAVKGDSDPALAGDEPVLLAGRSGCPLVVDPQRNRAAQALLAEHDVNIIVSDDGLQHYALARDLEVVVVDGQRRCGNGLLLPAGPLRESRRRLQQVDAVLVNGAVHNEPGFELASGGLRQVNGAGSQPIDDLRGTEVHAVAAIGNPERFFLTLEAAGMTIIRHPLPDHFAFTPDDIEFGDELPVLMTEKDAVKCRKFAGEKHWYMPVSAVPNELGAQRIRQVLDSLGSSS